MKCLSPSGRWPWMAGLCGGMLFTVLPMLIAGEETAWKTPMGTSKSQVLVLKSGRIVEGEISENAGGFVIDKSNGSMLIPFEHVQLRAADRRDAYHKLRQTLPERSPADHLKLARWCLTYHLYDECTAELRAVLTIDRDHEEARSMLRRLDEVLHPDDPVPKAVSKSQPRSDEGFRPPNTTSLAGLSRKTARQFVTEVQPILLNTCGNASCHGSATKTDFRLVNVSLGRGSHRVFAEQNLAQTLQLIDKDRPEHSPLLVVPRQNHGTAGEAVFHGPRADHQQQTLRQWVAAVAGELHRGPSSNAEMSSSPHSPSGPGSGVQQRPPVTKGPHRRVVEPHGTPPLGFDNLSTSAPRPAIPTAPQDDLLEAVLREERPDAFDPDIFNRMVHGSGETKPQ